jgi:hypothetical protein
MKIQTVIVTLLCFAAIMLLAVVAMRINAKAKPPVTAAAPTETPKLANSFTNKQVGKPAAPAPTLSGQTVNVAKSDAYILAQMAWGEARGCSDEEIAATMWCVCNRCDAWGLNIVEAVTAPGQFCGWSSGNPLDSHIYDLAVDVLTRWELEHTGQSDVGRVLPKEYLWFTGDGKHNAFRDAYQGGHVWDWSLPNVYEEAGK